MLIFAQTTQIIVGDWADGAIRLLNEFWGLIGGTAGIIAIIVAWRQSGALGRVKSAATSALVVSHAQAANLESQRVKINELAVKNPADVEPMPPSPPCPPPVTGLTPPEL